MSKPEGILPCNDVAPLLIFYACDEVTSEERNQIEMHLAACAACRTQLKEEEDLRTLLADNPQAADELDGTGKLLAQYRSELAEALDDLSAPPVREHWQPFGGMRRWMALRPAWSAALLVIFGAIVGRQILQMVPADGSASNGPTVNVLAGPKIPADLSKMSVAGISWRPSSDSNSGTVQVNLRAEQPVVLSGNLDDADMRRVLTYVISNGEKFDPGVRLDCLDALRERTSDASVRRALLAAARKDQNPAVRMKALEALRDSASDSDVRDVLVDALNHDTNPGVRVEAVNLLVRSLENASVADSETDQEDAQSGVAPAASAPDSSMARVIRALQELQRHDPNRYVRLRSAAALRQIGPQELQ